MRGGAAGGTEARKRFFFEKKKQKTFVSLAPNVGRIRILRNKVFLLLFLQKKKTLPSCAPHAEPARCLLAAALGLGGCSILPSRPFLQRRDWPLLVPGTPSLPPRAGGRVLLVGDVAAAPGLGGRGLQVLQPDGSVRDAVYEQWAVPPAEGVTEALRRWLAGGGAFAGVVGPGSGVAPGLVLEAELTELVAAPSAGVARAALAVVLVGRGRLLLQRTVRGEARLSGEAAPAVVAGMLAALAAALAEVEAAVAPFG